MAHLNAVELIDNQPSESDFWQLIDLLRGTLDDEAVARLTDALRRREAPEIIRFADQLSEKLVALDRAELFQQPITWMDSPNSAPLPTTADTFLYLRAGIVAVGQRAFERSLTDPSSLRTRPWPDGEPLLHVAEAAAGRPIDVSMAYETGGHVDHWPQPLNGGETGAPLVAVLLEDREAPIHAYVDEALTELGIVGYAWPLWFDHQRLGAVTAQVNEVVRRHPHILQVLNVAQVQVDVSFVSARASVPVVEESIKYEPGIGRILGINAEIEKTNIIESSQREQENALRQAVVSALLLIVSEHDAAKVELRELL